MSNISTSSPFFTKQRISENCAAASNPNGSIGNAPAPSAQAPIAATAVKELKHAAKDFSSFAQGSGAFEAFSTALIGTTTPNEQERTAINAVISAVSQGLIKPQVAVGEMADPDVKAGFLPGQNGKGTVVVSHAAQQSDITPDLMREELGEAIGHFARSKGLDVSAGDVGARFAKLYQNLPLDPRDFQSHPSDKATATLDGDQIEINAQRRGRYTGTNGNDKVNVNNPNADYYLRDGNDVATIYPNLSNSAVRGGPGNDRVILHNIGPNDVAGEEHQDYLIIRFRDSNGQQSDNVVWLADFERVTYGATGKTVTFEEFKKTAEANAKKRWAGRHFHLGGAD